MRRSGQGSIRCFPWRILRARPAALGVALGVVFLLNAAALLLFPWLGERLGLDARAFGEWCALAIHDTSSVAGAAATRGDAALLLATAMKLGRALWIAPVCAALAWAGRRSARGDATGAALRRQLPFPGFVVAFLAVAALVALVPALAPAGQWVAAGGRRGLVLALFAMGLAIDRAALRSISWRHLLLGVVLWAVLAAVALGLVR